MESERSGQNVGVLVDETGAPTGMKVLAATDAVEFITAQGGELFVWADLMQCCGRAVPFLTASTERPREEREFSRLSGQVFDLYYNDGGVERPGQLILELSGLRRKRLSVRTPDFWIKE
jgi:hypothetical protein